MRPFQPYDARKYSPDQNRDGHGRFSSGGSGALAAAGGAANAAKLVAGLIVVAGGVAHFQAYVHRLQKISRASSLHDAIRLAFSPVRRKSAPAPLDPGDDEIDAILAGLPDISDADAQTLLRFVHSRMSDQDAAAMQAALQRQGLMP